MKTISREILEEYAKQGMSQTQIAVELDVTQGTISAKMREYGLKTRARKKISNYDPERMKEYMQQGLTDVEIASRMDVCSSTVRNWIRNHDLKKFRQSPPKKLCPTCIYRDVRKYAGGCNYLDHNNHSRGCPVIGCTVYIKETPMDGRKKKRRKKKC